MTTPDTSIASRELDYFIHNKVLGHDLPTESQRARAQVGTIESYNWANIPHYSSSRAAAFELAGLFECFTMITNSTTKRCIVLIDDSQYVEGHSDDFPLVVCRAVIAAKGLSL